MNKIIAIIAAIFDFFALPPVVRNTSTDKLKTVAPELPKFK